MAQESSRPKLLWLLIIVMPLLGIGAALLATQLPLAAPVQPTQVAEALPTRVISSDLLNQGAPNFELFRLDAENSTRLSSLRGRVVFVNFWATWCEPCRREFPAFAAFTATQSADGPLILAVNVGESPEQINAFLDEIGVHSTRVLLDSDFQVSDRYQVEFYPSTFVINPAGRIAAFHPGEITLADLEDYVAEHSQN
jgi:thiol-disulfide isomerase/thioredoxin